MSAADPSENSSTGGDVEKASAVGDAQCDLDSLKKVPIRSQITNQHSSAIRSYQEFFIGKRDWKSLVHYELATSLSALVPGAAGYWVRKRLLGTLFARVGSGVVFGNRLALRHPYKIEIGDRTAIDDDCLLDARGVIGDRFVLGSDVLIAKGCVLRSKANLGFLDIGDQCTIGTRCVLSSSGGIRIGKAVGIAAHCFIGGARYHTDEDKPITHHDTYTTGSVEIGDGCSIGVGVNILDGVKIGAGSLIGAGVVVREDIGENTVVAPHQRLFKTRRELA